MSWALRLYSWLWYLATPLVRGYLRKRAVKAPAYLAHWDERFGQRLLPNAKQAIWIHAVSVGETRAALPLVEALRRQWPEAPLLVTQMTPTGRATAQTLYPDAEIRYLPYDYPKAVQSFLRAYQPRFGILMETELWPNLLQAASQQSIPLFLANARLSEKSLQGYQKIACLIRPAMGKLTAVAAQTTEDAERLMQLGAKSITVCGNTKYDITPPESQLILAKTFRQRIGKRPVVVCASTREGEETLILAAWQAATASLGNTLLVLIPRHPERFAEVAALVEQYGLSWQYRSDNTDITESTQVWVGDSMGEVFAYYACADVAFVGGSLVPMGGQNLIEPASLGVPVLFGPSIFNFKQAASLALAAGAAKQVVDAKKLITSIQALLQDETSRQMMRQAALTFSTAHRGASQRMVTLFSQMMTEPQGTAPY